MTTRSVLFFASIMATGLYAGLYFAFSVAVMPGLAKGTDAVYVAAMQNINKAIINPLFLAVFLGAPLLAIALAVAGGSGARGWLIAAAALHAVTFVVTVAFNVPLNDDLAAAGDPAAARDAFAGAWVAWNVVRTIATTGALACLARAAVG